MKIASSKQPRLSYCLWRCMQKQDDFMPMRITKILYEASAQQIADHMWKEFPNSCYGYKKVPPYRMCPIDEMTFYESDHYHPLAYAKRNGVCNGACLQKDYPYTGVFQKDHVIPQTAKIRFKKIIEVHSHEEARRATDNGHPVIARIRCFPGFNNFMVKKAKKVVQSPDAASKKRKTKETTQPQQAIMQEAPSLSNCTTIGLS